jgi:hypothetical protein
MANIITAGNSTNGGTAITTDTSGTLNIVTGSGSGATAISVDTSQNVGVGTTSPSTYGKLAVVAPTGQYCAAYLAANTSGTYYHAAFYNDTTQIGYQYSEGTNFGLAAVGASAGILFLANGSERMRINSSGGLILVGSTAQKATGTTWSNPSDQRLKNNIQDYTKGTAELMQVRVKEWEYNGKGGTTEGMKGIGVIADEIMTVLPNTVENYTAKLNSDDEETTEIKKFDATEITWLLVKTVQELKAELDALKAKVGE